MAESLQISCLGNPILRKTAQVVADVRKPEIQCLIENLIKTALRTQGVGIAAPQVGISQRVIIISSHPNVRYPDAPQMRPTAMINPQIIGTDGEKFKGWEGCLSVPGLRGLVNRDRAIKIAYTDRQGKQQEREFTDFVARIIQHELDHLNGKVFLDRLETPQNLVSERDYSHISPRL